jgi:hypothetical protein
MEEEEYSPSDDGSYDTNKPKKRITPTKLKQKFEKIVRHYISINPMQHRKEDIEVFFDFDTRKFKWICKCTPEKAYPWEGVQKIHSRHAFINRHCKFIEHRMTEFDPIACWDAFELLPDMLHFLTDGFVSCGYCNVSLPIDQWAFLQHIKSSTHKSNVAKHRLEAQVKLTKTYVNHTKKKKRERSHTPEN